MSKGRYTLLPESEQMTPAMEVSLTAADNDSTQQTQPQQQQQQMPNLTEINLNETSSAPSIATSAQPNLPVNVSLSGPAGASGPSLAELPSYNEALRLKKLEGGEIPPSYFATLEGNNTARDLPSPMITIDAADLRAIAEASGEHGLGSDLRQEVGSECMFLCAFMIAFFFNWVGFFVSICLLPNAAGKYGALSGFGLSMAKWVTIVRYQDWVTNMNDFQQKLFFWLFVCIGFYLFFRGLINFTTLKYRPAAHTEYSRRMRNRLFWFIE